MQRILLLAEKLAQKNIPVTIYGEPGTGKELLARFIHAISPRADQPFVAINCAALPETLLESELFGYEKGAFTGAVSYRKGFFELAHQGTLFLDEIGEASVDLQVKLLRVLETGKFYRVGGEKLISVDVRIIAATNADLERLVKERRFREDLFYRLDVARIDLPPLRDRKEDIPLLLEHFLFQFCSDSDKVPYIHPEVMEALRQYEWPGNVRELKNVAMKLAIEADDCSVILKEQLPERIKMRLKEKGYWEERCILNFEKEENKQLCSPEAWIADLKEKIDIFVDSIELDNGLDLPQLLKSFRRLETRLGRKIVERVLKKTKGSYPKATALLKASPRVLRYLLKEKR